VLLPNLYRTAKRWNGFNLKAKKGNGYRNGWPQVRIFQSTTNAHINSRDGSGHGVTLLATQAGYEMWQFSPNGYFYVPFTLVTEGMSWWRWLPDQIKDGRNVSWKALCAKRKKILCFGRERCCPSFYGSWKSLGKVVVLWVRKGDHVIALILDSLVKKTLKFNRLSRVSLSWSPFNPFASTLFSQWEKG